MTTTLFGLPPVPAIPVEGETAAYPIGRIFCVGRNYAAHAAEMGGEVDREAPWYFTKTPANAVLSGAVLPYPPGTSNHHHEMELALAIGAPVFRAGREQAMAAIYAYGCALDMTRRDLQQVAKDNRRPWSLAKDLEGGAVLAPMKRAADFGAVTNQRIHLEVNGETRQDATLAEMVWTVDEIVSHLSHYYHLRPGDVILTGTPAGVGPVRPGDVITGGIDGLAPVRLSLTDPE
ncbi:fumarylacetoacetate hydrolase family protein [Jhaorihella thermophila]|uniref:Fumarylpyruvate hydrolase n=1 Tax=Jhaorihella thermophila TaxID=488547 RepID=A0A1H5UWP2_9RHOB|nr:fumarylacetoacetate hydrolase family protein [Jhaorihella thermophila]SEF79582.1 fumarylpyruvate hydrolase [Jhaorihella thermophila]